MENKKSLTTRYVILLIIGILIIIVAVVGVTYAFMGNNVPDPIENTETTLESCVRVSLLDTDSISINLTNTVPVTDNVGLNTTPYEFTISSTCTESQTFGVYLALFKSNTLAYDKIKFALKDKDTGSFVVTATNLKNQTESSSQFTDYELKSSDGSGQISTSIGGNVGSVYALTSGTISTGSTKTYQLYLWVDGDVTDSMGSTFNAGVVAKAKTS